MWVFHLLLFLPYKPRNVNIEQQLYKLHILDIWYKTFPFFQQVSIPLGQFYYDVRVDIDAILVLIHAEELISFSWPSQC
jgi:hypothetical protein